MLLYTSTLVSCSCRSSLFSVFSCSSPPFSFGPTYSACPYTKYLTPSRLSGNGKASRFGGIVTGYWIWWSFFGQDSESRCRPPSDGDLSRKVQKIALSLCPCDPRGVVVVLVMVKRGVVCKDRVLDRDTVGGLILERWIVVLNGAPEYSLRSRFWNGWSPVEGRGVKSSHRDEIDPLFSLIWVIVVLRVS